MTVFSICLFPIIVFLILLVIIIVIGFKLSYKPDDSPPDTEVSGVISGFMYRIMNLKHTENELWDQYDDVTEMVEELNVHKMPLSLDDPEWNTKIDEVATELVVLDEKLIYH